MTQHIATIKIVLREKDATHGILERISDLASDHGAEDDGSSLSFTIEDDNQDDLRKRADELQRAFRKFLTDATVASNIYITYSETA
jgi:hypothetical protein